MSIQKMSWGQMEWLATDDDPIKQNGMSIGITTILPHVEMVKHIHYEVEQFIYILKGEGTDIADEEVRQLHPGVFYYLKPNITHSEVNTGDEDLVHLTISVPTAFQNTVDLEHAEIEHFSSSFCGAVEAIRGQLMEQSSLPIAIFDDMGKLVLQNNKYPRFCVHHCDPQEHAEECPCFSCRNATGVQAEICPYGLTVLRLPIRYGSHYLGSIFSGHILLGSDDLKASDMYDTPLGTLLGIKRWLRSVAQSLVSYCSFDTMRRSLSQKNIQIQKNLETQTALEADLRSMRTTVTNLRINRHFLFNTLNAIAGQALSGNRMSTYQSIVDLAKMLRYSSTDALQMVPLRSEVEYLKTYLHMQELRYMEELKIQLECPEDIMDVPVVFNFLQPVIENAFTHGFSNLSGQKKLNIRIWKQGDRLVFSVINNGGPVDKVTLNRVQSGLASNSGHGLSLIYSNLQMVYGNRFAMELRSDNEQETEVYLEIPCLEKKGERKV